MIRRDGEDNLFWGEKYIGNIYPDVDGYYKWWPDSDLRGFMDTYFLRKIADFLENENGEWDKVVADQC